MIANITGSSESFEETHNTLKYANRAKNIKTSAVRNVHSVEYQVAQYTEIIARLQNEVQDLKGQLLVQAGRTPKTPQKTTPSQRMIQAQSSPHGLPTVNERTSSVNHHDPAFTKYKEQIEAHFNQETRSKKRIHELEQKQETAKLSVINKNNEIKALAGVEEKKSELRSETPSLVDGLPKEQSQPSAS